MEKVVQPKSSNRPDLLILNKNYQYFSILSKNRIGKIRKTLEQIF